MSGTWKLIFDGGTAVGTLAVAAVAVWGEKIKSILTPPKLSIRLHTPQGVPVSLQPQTGGLKFMYYHMKVVNERRWIAAQDCRVLLTGLARRGPDSKFHKVSLPVPLEFMWAAAQAEPSAPRRRTIVREQVVDFGRIRDQGTDNRFTPTFFVMVASFDGHVATGEAVRYYVELEALNFVSKRPTIFEVAWDGQFHFSPEEMQKHLRVREVPWREAHPD